MSDSGFATPEESKPAPAPSTPAERIRGAGNSVDDDGIESERDLWEGGYSGKAMTGSWILALLGSILLLIVMVYFASLRTNGTAWMVFLVLVLLVWGGLAALMLYRKLSHKYELTTQRFKHRDGIFTRVSDRIELIDIDDVTVKQGPIQAILGVGTIRVQSSDTTHPELMLLGIDQVRDVADMIDDARRTERRKRGIHIEAV